MDLYNKKIIVTGGAKRCGAEIVRQFADLGAKLIIHCNHSILEAEQLLETLPNPRNHQIQCADLADCNQRRQLIEKIQSADVIVNNASIYSPELLKKTFDPVAEEINYIAPVELINSLIKDNGTAINILDQEILQSSPPCNAYLDSRKKLAVATLRLAVELAPRNIRVNGVAPGAMLPPQWLPESRMNKQRASSPLHRTAVPADYAATVIFLCQNDSVTGAIIPVDCGQHLNNS